MSAHTAEHDDRHTWMNISGLQEFMWALPPVGQHTHVSSMVARGGGSRLSRC